MTKNCGHLRETNNHIKVLPHYLQSSLTRILFVILKFPAMIKVLRMRNLMYLVCSVEKGSIRELKCDLTDDIAYFQSSSDTMYL